jgi:hypothetical protein
MKGNFVVGDGTVHWPPSVDVANVDESPEEESMCVFVETAPSRSSPDDAAPLSGRFTADAFPVEPDPTVVVSDPLCASLALPEWVPVAPPDALIAATLTAAVVCSGVCPVMLGSPLDATSLVPDEEAYEMSRTPATNSQLGIEQAMAARSSDSFQPLKRYLEAADHDRRRLQQDGRHLPGTMNCNSETA